MADYQQSADAPAIGKQAVEQGAGQMPEVLAALKAAGGYLLNAKIDLETGAPKRTAIMTIEGGLRVVEAAIRKATGAA